MKRIPAHELSSEILGSKVLFIGFASFEQRCLTASTNLPSEKIGKALILINRNNPNPIISENCGKMKSYLGSSAKEVPINISDPFDMRECIAFELRDISQDFDQCVLDVTTFTHEALAITVDLLSERWPGKKWIILYNGAAKYDTAHDQADELWLTKRPSGVRSILGFSGDMHPSRKLHLLILVGFEHERAHYAIEAFEPSVITLGVGEKSRSVSDSLADLNAHFFRKVDSFASSMAATYSKLNRIEFSCTEAERTAEAVRNIVREHAEFNTIICPMNTKLSTLGAILAAIENPSIQLAYVSVDEYNEDAYAAASGQITVDELVFPRKISTFY